MLPSLPDGVRVVYTEAACWKRRAVLEEPGTTRVSRTLAVSYARLGDRLEAVPFTEDSLRRIAEILNDLGLPS